MSHSAMPANTARASAAVTRFGESRLPDAHTLVQADDVLHIVVPSQTVSELDDQVQEGPSDV